MNREREISIVALLVLGVQTLKPGRDEATYRSLKKALENLAHEGIVSHKMPEELKKRWKGQIPIPALQELAEQLSPGRKLMMETIRAFLTKVARMILSFFSSVRKLLPDKKEKLVSSRTVEEDKDIENRSGRKVLGAELSAEELFQAYGPGKKFWEREKKFLTSRDEPLDQQKNKYFVRARAWAIDFKRAYDLETMGLSYKIWFILFEILNQRSNSYYCIDTSALIEKETARLEVPYRDGEPLDRLPKIIVLSGMVEVQEKENLSRMIYSLKRVGDSPAVVWISYSYSGYDRAYCYERVVVLTG